MPIYKAANNIHGGHGNWPDSFQIYSLLPTIHYRLVYSIVSSVIGIQELGIVVVLLASCHNIFIAGNQNHVFCSS